MLSVGKKLTAFAATVEALIMTAVHGRTHHFPRSHAACPTGDRTKDPPGKSTNGRTKYGDNRTYGRTCRRSGTESGIARGRTTYSTSGHTRFAPALILLDIETPAHRATHTHGDSLLERYSIFQNYLQHEDLARPCL